MALLPLGTIQGPVSSSFVPAMVSVVACFDLISVYLLVGDYRDRGDLRLLVMAAAYTWSLIVMLGYTLAFPGAVSPHPPLAVNPSMPPYLYVAWHVGFPVLLGAAWWPWPAGWTTPTVPHRRPRLIGAGLGSAVLTSTTVVAGLVSLAPVLPTLIIGLDTSRMTKLTAPVALPLVAISLGLAVRGTRRRSGPERWASVAILACLLDLVLTYSARSRFSLGWYGGRTLTLLSAGVVMIAMLGSFRRLKAFAEHHAAVDSLTGVRNRRTAYESLDQLFARHQRSGTPLGLITLDIDYFKSINDTHGHETGDEVLSRIGRTLTTSCRVSDVVARVGGEEFLILLPDTAPDGTYVVAEKIRCAIAAMRVDGLSAPVTASVGATGLRSTDSSSAALLRRADAALYAAKHAGRNTTAVAPHDGSRPGPRVPIS